MRRPIAVSVFMALILPSLAAPQNSGSQSAARNAPSEVQVTGNQNRTSSNVDNCECVPFYQCDNKTLRIKTDGIDIIDIQSRRGTCPSYLDICCMPPDVVSSEEPDDPLDEFDEPSAQNLCGKRNPNGVGFRTISNFHNETQFGEYPWMTAILLVGNNGKESNLCGGSLIHPRAVLTAANHIHEKQPNQLKIRVGEWDAQTEKEPYPHYDHDVEKIIIHEEFHPRALRNDIAILILKTPVKLVSHVDLVCLAETNENFDGTRCLATGWGKDKFGAEGRYQSILKSIDLPVVPHNICQTILRDTRLGRYFQLNRSFMCAGGELGKDTCQGDSGGPLICPLKSDENRYVQVGIVSWGMECGENQIPGVYANVAHLRQWIDMKMNNNNLDTNVYQA